jgi:anti-anti-sigma regulatory factor
MHASSRDPLEIEVQNSDQRTLVTLSGELDASTASSLYDTLSELEVRTPTTW